MNRDQIITSWREMQTGRTASSMATQVLSFSAETIRMDELFFKTGLFESINAGPLHALVF
ncbi:MAG: hypothetical protein VX346_19855 [Planctomycetota bacterium]|nr:hypothetical protein [Planctomycetota bacterium]